MSKSHIVRALNSTVKKQKKIHKTQSIKHKQGNNFEKSSSREAIEAKERKKRVQVF